jgi:hypothetical protein
LSYAGGSKPDDWCFLRTTVRNNVFMDDDLAGGVISIPFDRADGAVVDTFTRANGAVGRTEIGNIAWETWMSSGGSWAIVSGAAVWTSGGSGRGHMMLDLTGGAINGGNRDVSVTYTATTGTPFITFHSFATAPNAAHKITMTVGSKLNHNGVAGATTLTAGTHTVRVVVSGTVQGVSATVAVYLDGVLEIGPQSVSDVGYSGYDRWGFGVEHGATGVAFTEYNMAEIAPLAATSWQAVQLVGGSVAASGVIDQSDITIDIADADLEMPTGGPYGVYHLKLYGPDRLDGVDGDRSAFRDTYGDIIFSRIPSHDNEITKPTKTAASASVVAFDVLSHQWLGMGPARWERVSTSAAGILAGATQEAAWRALESPHRPRVSIALWSDGSRTYSSALTWTDPAKASLTAEVATMKAHIGAYESFNEPGVVISGYDPNVLAQAAAFTNEQHIPFHDTVKAEHPAAIIVGPSILGFQSGLYIDNLHAAGFFDYCDALSFHAYNLCRRDIGRTRRLLDEMYAKLAEYGLENIPVWQTEQGGLSEWDGVFVPEEAGRDESTVVFMCELYGIIKERNIVWYDIAHGFDSYPAWHFGYYDQAALAVPILMRNFEAELWGTQLTTRFDFDSAADLYAGGVFTRDDTSGVVGIMGQSSELADVSVAITGTTSPLELVDPWGNVTTVPVVAGRAAVPVAANLVHWLRLPAGVTAALVAGGWAWGTNLALSTGGASIATSGATFTNAVRAINGTHYSQGGYYGRPAYANSGTFDGAFPHYWTVDLGGTQTINTVTVRLIDATDVELQASTNGTDWTTLTHYQHTALMDRYPGNGRCFWNRYQSPAMAFDWHGSQRSASHIRLKVNNTMATEQYLVAFDEVAQAVEVYDDTWPQTFHRRMTHVLGIGAFNAATARRTVLLLAAT